MAQSAVLHRTRFTMSRALEFFSERELSMQIGIGRAYWGLALVKELVDNSLDACEDAAIAPDITVTHTDEALTVADNGPGIPDATIRRSLDYLIRVSDKAFYVSPSRGQLGNALKCAYAAPFVAHGRQGRVTIRTQEQCHQITVALNPLSQAPDLTHEVFPDPHVKTGTIFTLYLPFQASSIVYAPEDEFYTLRDQIRLGSVRELLDHYAVFNPHATFTYCVPEQGDPQVWPARKPDWPKWRPHNPTSPHWYSVERFRALLAAYISHDRETGRTRPVREVVAEFAGLSGSAKQKRATDAAGLTGATLTDLIHNNDLDRDAVARLLQAMQAESRTIRPAALGILDKDALTPPAGSPARSYDYKRVVDVTRQGLPYVIEAACWFSTGHRQRNILIGLNWSPAVKHPFSEMGDWLAEARIDLFDPVRLLLHVACPQLDFTDRGKSTLALPGEMADDIGDAITAVSKVWAGLKRHADKERRVSQRAMEHHARMQRREIPSVKQAAWAVLAQAYAHASGNGRYPANARQIMYAARPLVLALTDGKCWKNSDYFTQDLLPGFLAADPDRTASWDVVFDARGHFAEPYTGEQIGLGTVEVRDYVATWQDEALPTGQTAVTLPHTIQTVGPQHRYRNVLFIEKEGFNPLLAQAQISERYDLALMSTKGMSVTAARQLVEALSHLGVRVFVLHDFDKSGFSIVQTLRGDTRRYTYSTAPTVIDLGLRLTDVEEMGLQEEEVSYGRGVDPRENLRANGATEEECDFLVREGGPDGWEGARVELNSMTTVQFIDWLEAKLEAHNVEKFVPSDAALATAYQHLKRIHRLQLALNEAQKHLPNPESIAVPPDLRPQIQARIAHTNQPWDLVLWTLLQEQRNSPGALGAYATTD